MVAKRSKKRRVDDGTNVDKVESSPANKSRRKLSDGASEAGLGALEAKIERLHSGLDAARDVLRAARFESELNAEALQRVVDYAHRTSYIAAPHGYVPGESQLYMMRPPAPQTMQLQQSILHTLVADLVGKQQKLYTAGNHQKNQLEDENDTQTNKSRMDADAASSKPVGAGDVVAMSTDLSPDMVAVLKHIPEMPAGWRPGDPIPGLPKPRETGAEAAKIPLEPTAKAEKSPDQVARKPTSFALGLEVDDLDFAVAAAATTKIQTSSYFI
jgi:hypothetical protein